VETFREARPTELVAFPRVYEKLAEFVKVYFEQQRPIIKMFLKWAREKGY